jgi:hypothetical protein
MHKLHLPFVPRARNHVPPMTYSETTKGRWRISIAFAASAAAALAALIALRGPDAIGLSVAQTVGTWKLSGPALWDGLMPTGLLGQILFTLAETRGWQNAHVVVAWLTTLCWFVSLPAKTWRGLFPLVPALLATVLSNPASGFTGFGLAVLFASAWRAFMKHQTTGVIMVTLPVLAWLIVWLSPGAWILILVALVEMFPRLRWKRWLAATALVVVLTQLTPRGFAVWSEAWIFLRWSPQASLDAAGTTALLITLVVLLLAGIYQLRERSASVAAAPLMLLLAAGAGQTAYLWPAALWMMPCWPAAKEQLGRSGYRIRWFVGLAMVLGASGLVLLPAKSAWPRWYSLAMTDAVVRPTLTREALPARGPVFINPRGLGLARFSGPLPDRASSGESSRLSREPSLWREFDRTARYSAVWLLGDKSDYAPLARHLGESPDWRLASVDATGVLFLRQPRIEEFATEPAQQYAREMWGGANRSQFLAGAALSSLVANYLTEAGELSLAATSNSRQSAPAAAAHARTLTASGVIRPALEESLRATKLDPTSVEAWEARTEALLHAGMVNDAYAASQRAARLAPGDTGTLWLAARTANAARAFQTEAELLEALISLTEGRGGDAGFYYLYLGQSYAKLGLTRPALYNLEKAAAAPGLTGDQRGQLREEIEGIRSSPAAR